MSTHPDRWYVGYATPEYLKSCHLEMWKEQVVLVWGGRRKVIKHVVSVDGIGYVSHETYEDYEREEVLSRKEYVKRKAEIFEWFAAPTLCINSSDWSLAINRISEGKANGKTTTPVWKRKSGGQRQCWTLGQAEDPDASAHQPAQ